jgi:hypothetical protein
MVLTELAKYMAEHIYFLPGEYEEECVKTARA